MKYTIGIDFGTESARAVLVRLSDGAEVASAVSAYADGVIDEVLPGQRSAWSRTGRCRIRGLCGGRTRDGASRCWPRAGCHQRT